MCKIHMNSKVPRCILCRRRKYRTDCLRESMFTHVEQAFYYPKLNQPARGFSPRHLRELYRLPDGLRSHFATLHKAQSNTACQAVPLSPSIGSPHLLPVTPAAWCSFYEIHVAFQMRYQNLNSASLFQVLRSCSSAVHPFATATSSTLSYERKRSISAE